MYKQSYRHLTLEQYKKAAARKAANKKYRPKKVPKLWKPKKPKDKMVSVKVQGNIKYSIYIKSKFWFKRRKAYFKTHKRECYCCFSTKNIVLHHLSYKNLGNEPDEDLLSLCSTCHQDYHDTYGVKRVMVQETSEFVDLRRQEFEFKEIVKNF